MEALSRAIGRLETLEKNTQFIVQDLFTSREWKELQNLNETQSLGKKFNKVVALNVLPVKEIVGYKPQKYEKE